MPGSHLGLSYLQSCCCFCNAFTLSRQEKNDTWAKAQEIEFPPYPELSDFAIHSNTIIYKYIYILYSCRSETPFRCKLEKAGDMSWAGHFVAGLASRGVVSSSLGLAGGY